QARRHRGAAAAPCPAARILRCLAGRRPTAAAATGKGSMLIRARAPLRLGLAGGGTDIASYASVHGGLVLNATIDRYAYAVIRTLDQPVVRFAATDKQVAESAPLAPELALANGLDLHRTVYNEIVRTYNGGRPIALELSTFCDAPAGSGLGSSSTLVV